MYYPLDDTIRNTYYLTYISPEYIANFSSLLKTAKNPIITVNVKYKSVIPAKKEAMKEMTTRLDEHM